MAATPHCQVVESAVLARFPDARFGRYNCRHIGSNPLRSWSQHAGSESNKYFGNALDITHKDHGYTVSAAHTAWLRQVYGFLRSFVIVDQLLGPGDRGHSDHVHVSTWPKMRSVFWYRPPCKGGALVVIHEDGTIGNTFGTAPPPPPPPTMGDDMAFRRNDTGKSIERMQQALLAWNADSLPIFGADGDYGAESEAAVTAYQLAAQLDQVVDTDLGVCDGNTYNQLLEFLPDRVVATHGHDDLQGAKGDQGEQGVQGEQGAIGPQGVQGDPGEGISTGDELTVTVN